MAIWTYMPFCLVDKCLLLLIFPSNYPDTFYWIPLVILFRNIWKLQLAPLNPIQLYTHQLSCVGPTRSLSSCNIALHKYEFQIRPFNWWLDGVVVSIPGRKLGDLGSIPGRALNLLNGYLNSYALLLSWQVSPPIDFSGNIKDARGEVFEEHLLAKLNLKISNNMATK